MFYWQLGQMLLQTGVAQLLQIGANVTTNRNMYNKLRQRSLQNKATVTNSEKIYYKLGQVLQFMAIITN